MYVHVVGKAFTISYMAVTFRSMRPESLAIYKKTSEDSPWTPYQYYSSSCQSTYQVALHPPGTPLPETGAICTDQNSDLSPLTLGNVIFNSLLGRPGIDNYATNPRLQV
jgi:laminin gamma 1